MKTHRNLEVWKKSMHLVTQIYIVSKNFPKEEISGLTTQMRGSAISIPSNISEGVSRKGDKEFIQFLHIALGSNSELETQIIIASNLHYIDPKQRDDLLLIIYEIGKMLGGLINYIKNKTNH